MQQTKRKKVYFGWWIVAAGFVIMALSYAPTVTMLGLFIKPMAEDFGVGRTLSTIIAVIASVAGMLTSLFAGKFLAKYSLKKTAAIALVLQAVNYVGMALSPNLPIIFVTAFLRGAFNMFITTLPISILINNWFGSKIRGKAWGIAMVGSGVGSMLLTPITGLIISSFGWRFGYVFFGALSLVQIPLVIITYVRHPRDKGLEVIGEPEPTTANAPAGRLDNSGIRAKDALRTPMFWIIVMGIILMAGSLQAWNVSGAAFLSDQGFELVHVSFLLSISSVGLIVGKVALGAISDRWGTQWGITFSVGLYVVGIIMAFFVGRITWLAYPMMVLLGIGIAAATVTVPLVTRDLFGIREYGTIAGFTESSLKLGTSILPLSVSLVYDLLGSYMPAWAGVLVLCGVSLVLTFVAYGMRGRVWRKYADAPDTVPVANAVPQGGG